MKHFNHGLAILPLLSILAMSPSIMQTKFAERQIASVQEEVKEFPEYEALVSTIKPEKNEKDVELDIHKFKEKLSKEREEFKKDQSDETIVKEQRQKIESLVRELHLIEQEKKDDKECKANDSSDVIVESKEVLEGLIADLEANEVLVAAASQVKTEEAPKKEETPVLAEEKTEKKPEEKVEEKVEEKKEEPKKEICEAEEKNKVLTAQVEALMQQQNQIMQTLLGMAQMMVSMHQNQSSMPNPYYANGNGFQIQNPYQYNQPYTSGNWVYYPNGFQPNQGNIFAQPQMPQVAPQQAPGIYPDQMHEKSNWELRPSNDFGDARFQAQPVTPGPFGNEAFSFNMANNVPTVSQN